MFLAYKSVSQKPKHFFRNLYNKMNYIVLDNLMIGKYGDLKELQTLAETDVPETVNRNENTNDIETLRSDRVLTNEVLAAARAQKKFVFGHQSGQLFHKPQFQNGFDKCISYIYSVEFFVEFFSKKSYEDFTIIRGQ